jgi:hypothetical protein
MPEFRIRVSRHRFPDGRIAASVAKLVNPSAVRILVLGREARDSDAHEFKADIGGYSLRNDGNEYDSGRGTYWSLGRYPNFWTLAHRVVFESWKPRLCGEKSYSAERIRTWFDKHRLGSPLAFADVSPIHANSGEASRSRVPFKKICGHLADLLELERRAGISPAVVIHPPIRDFEKTPGFDAAELRKSIARLGDASHEAKFFYGPNWERGRTLGDEILERLRDAMAEWDVDAG